jgi:hypothetical protein
MYKFTRKIIIVILPVLKPACFSRMQPNLLKRDDRSYNEGVIGDEVEVFGVKSLNCSSNTSGGSSRSPASRCRESEILLQIVMKQASVRYDYDL